MSVTEIGASWLSSSMRRPSVKAFTACLEAEYWVCRIMVALGQDAAHIDDGAAAAGADARAAISEPLTTPQ